MVKVKPFAAVRPSKALVKEISSRPYDVMSSAEAQMEAGEKSLLHVTRPEIDFDPMADPHEQRSYDKAVENYALWKERGWLVKEKQECYYVYAQSMEGRTQYGIALCANVEDYESGAIKKHELTLKAKEDDRMVHIRIQNANIEPVFFAYPANQTIDAIVAKYIQREPDYDFTASEDGFGHQLWTISEKEDIAELTSAFETVPAFYIADGHHRTAAAARVGAQMRDSNPNHRGDEEYNWFMAVCFPDNQLKIMDYNRLVKDLNGLSETEFIEKLEKHFDVHDMGEDVCRPMAAHMISMYLSGHWYALMAGNETFDDNDPTGALDVSTCTRYILDEILGIKDIRTSERIAFVGGIRGLGELKRRVDSGEMKVAFALYPVSMAQLIKIADAGAIMPPKSTWFEPKLRSGLFIHELI